MTKYGANVSPFKIPTTISKKSVYPVSEPLLSCFCEASLLYMHNDLNNNNNNNNTSGLFRFWYERVYFFLPSALGDTRRETQFIRAYANYTILTTPRMVHLAPSKISTHFCLLRPKLIWSDLKKSMARFDSWTSTHIFFKIPKFSGHCFWAWHHLPTWCTPTAGPAPFLVWKFVMTDDDCHMFSTRAFECTIWR